MLEVKQPPVTELGHRTLRGPDVLAGGWETGAMTAAIGFHVATGTLAIGVGAAVLLAAKGTRRHRWLGWTYVAAMAAMLASSFVIRSESGGFTLFHGVSIATAAVVALGLAMSVLWRRRVRTWPLWHLRLMSASWLILVLTMMGQFFPWLPLPHPALDAIVFLQVPAMIGFALIVRAGRGPTVAGALARSAHRGVRAPAVLGRGAPDQHARGAGGRT
jgi:uncharacterized membrane protein